MGNGMKYHYIAGLAARFAFAMSECEGRREIGLKINKERAAAEVTVNRQVTYIRPIRLVVKRVKFDEDSGPLAFCSSVIGGGNFARIGVAGTKGRLLFASKGCGYDGSSNGYWSA
jgi:hypothetical protein